MPVEHLPAPAWQTALRARLRVVGVRQHSAHGAGDRQDGYDWGILAYAVGFGGSMIWFGSSAGVALSNQYPEARSVFAWLTRRLARAMAYVVGFAVMLLLLGWHPHPLKMAP